MVKDLNKMISKNIFIILPIIIVLALVHGFTTRKAANNQANIAFIGAKSVDDPAGARLESVEVMGFASNFGLQQGDIVRKINGQTVKGANSFLDLMGEIAEDSVVKIEVLRDGIETTVGRGVDTGSSGNRMNGLQRHT
jgi:S1-C subfamily serine protease